MKKNLFLILFLLFSLHFLKAQDANQSDSVRNDQKIIVVQTTLGESFKGYFISQDSSSIKIKTFSVGEVSISMDKVKSIEFINKNTPLEKQSTAEQESAEEENEASGKRGNSPRGLLGGPED